MTGRRHGGSWPTLLALLLAACGGGEAPPPTDSMSAAGMAVMPEAPAATGHEGMSPEEMAAMTPAGVPREGTLAIPPARLQAIGVRYGPAARRTLERHIRAVGQVALDERGLARVNVKTEGWIEELHVSTTGQEVRRGEVLFTLYSPALVAAQEEYLLAFRSANTLGESAVPEVATGARSVLEAARRRLAYWDIADAHVRELENSGRIVRALPIHAPRGGTVLEKMVVAGMRVMPGEDLYVIADLSQVWILADIYEYELPYVALGQVARLSLLNDPDPPLEGRLAFIYPVLNQETRTARLRFELANPGGRLKPGMYVSVALSAPLGERLVLPRDAVLETGQRQVIFVRQGEGNLSWRTVRTGVRAGDWVEILAGVSEGEQVVTSANFLLDSESQVRSAMAGMAGMDQTGGSP